ncbi:MAG TPA: J domain-containing protein [Lacipirellulaceae bacterium]|nr:J domain-containing protein [Lacipirellulaceae bacterium]
MAIATTATDFYWPDGIDWVVTAAFVALILGAVAAAHITAVLDIRAYLRSLRRAMVLISHYRLDLPDWIRHDTPRCIQALGLTMPCTSDDVLTAYRQRVKLLHPDRGGNRREFLRLQQHFEQAMALVAKE